MTETTSNPSSLQLLLHPQLGCVLLDMVGHKGVLSLRGVSSALYEYVEHFAADAAFELLAPHLVSPERFERVKYKLAPWTPAKARRFQLLLGILFCTSSPTGSGIRVSADCVFKPFRFGGRDMNEEVSGIGDDQQQGRRNCSRTAATLFARKVWSLIPDGAGLKNADSGGDSDRPVMRSFVLSTGMAVEKLPAGCIWPLHHQSDLRKKESLFAVPKWLCYEVESGDGGDEGGDDAGDGPHTTPTIVVRRLSRKTAPKFPPNTVVVSCPTEPCFASAPNELHYGPVLPLWTNIVDCFLFGPPWIERIGPYFLSPCQSLKTLRMDGFVNLDTIGESFCEYATSLETISFSRTVRPRVIGAWFLSRCFALQEFDPEFLQSTTEIKQGFLYRCYGIKHLDLTPLVGLKEMERDFVNELNGLESIVVGPLGSVSSLPADFLFRSKSLTHVDFSALKGRELAIGSGFLSRCPALEKVDLSPLSRATSVERRNFLFHSAVPLVPTACFPHLPQEEEFHDLREFDGEDISMAAAEEYHLLVAKEQRELARAANLFFHRH